MDQSLRVLFDRALSDEPLPPPGDMAREAMVGGRRLRRKRQLVIGGAAGLIAVLAAVVAVNVGTGPSTPLTAVALAMRAGCVERDEIAVFLNQDVTDQQRAALDASLRSDPRVRAARYESKEQAYAAFKWHYRDAPDLVNAVRPDQLPESFRVTPAGSSGRLALQEELQRRPGVETVVGDICVHEKRSGEGE